MKTISERIKYIRLNAAGKKLSQEEFGQSVGLSRGAIANLEDAENRLPNGVPDSTVKLICATYHVSYRWLAEGKEPIFLDMDADSLVDRYAPDESPYFRACVRGAMRLSDADWIKFRDFVENMREKLQNGDQEADEP